MGGSEAAGKADLASDLDLYVYVHTSIPLAERRRIAATYSGSAEVGNLFWGPGDVWVDDESGLDVDVMFLDVGWIEAHLDRVLRQHAASMGYSTCFWHTVRSSLLLYDRQGWFHTVQQQAQEPYPSPLQRAIIALNYPILRKSRSSYLHQLELAVARGDEVSINHRIAALLASYFDILFAVNRLPHPGEKRLVQHAIERCPKVPVRMADQVRQLIHAVSAADRHVICHAHTLIDGLDQLLREERLHPAAATTGDAIGTSPSPPS
jgi:hypothetical protein